MANEGFGNEWKGNDVAADPASSESPKLDASSLSGLDDNYALYQQHAGEEVDPLEAKRVLRKVDLRVLPVLFTIYLLQYLDKNGINYAEVYGLNEGTGLSGQVSKATK